MKDGRKDICEDDQTEPRHSGDEVPKRRRCEGGEGYEGDEEDPVPLDLIEPPDGECWGADAGSDRARP